MVSIIAFCFLYANSLGLRPSSLVLCCRVTPCSCQMAILSRSFFQLAPLVSQITSSPPFAPFYDLPPPVLLLPNSSRYLPRRRLPIPFLLIPWYLYLHALLTLLPLFFPFVHTHLPNHIPPQLTPLPPSPFLIPVHFAKGMRQPRAQHLPLSTLDAAMLTGQMLLSTITLTPLPPWYSPPLA